MDVTINSRRYTAARQSQTRCVKPGSPNQPPQHHDEPQQPRRPHISNRWHASASPHHNRRSATARTAEHVEHGSYSSSQLERTRVSTVHDKPSRPSHALNEQQSSTRALRTSHDQPHRRSNPTSGHARTSHGNKCSLLGHHDCQWCRAPLKPLPAHQGRRCTWRQRTHLHATTSAATRPSPCSAAIKHTSAVRWQRGLDWSTPLGTLIQHIITSR